MLCFVPYLVRAFTLETPLFIYHGCALQAQGKERRQKRDPYRNDSYFLPSQESLLLEPDFPQRSVPMPLISLIIHSFLERNQEKKGVVRRNGEVSKPICSTPEVFLTSLFSSVLFMLEFQNIEGLLIHSFALSFCVYCRVHWLDLSAHLI